MGNWLKETVDLMRLRAQGRRELRRLPKDEFVKAYNEGWIDRFWRLPPDEWESAVDLRLEQNKINRSLRRLAERPTSSNSEALSKELTGSGESSATRLEDRIEIREWSVYGRVSDEKSWTAVSCSIDDPFIDEFRHDLAEIEREIKEESEKLASTDSRESPKVEGMVEFDFEKFDHAQWLIQSAKEEVRRDRYGLKLAEPLVLWLAKLPSNAKEDGLLACAVWQEMVELRGALFAAIQERQAAPGAYEAEAKRVMDIRMLFLRDRIRRCELLYRDVAETFFDRYGRPPLPKVSDPEITPSNKQVLRQRKWLRSRYADLDEMANEDKDWKAWLRNIRGGDRSTALRVRVLYDELATLRTRLVTEVLAKPPDDPQAQASLETLKPDLIRADREYRALAEPIFEKHGKPRFLRPESSPTAEKESRPA